MIRNRRASPKTHKTRNSSTSSYSVKQSSSALSHVNISTVGSITSRTTSRESTSTSITRSYTLSSSKSSSSASTSTARRKHTHSQFSTFSTSPQSITSQDNAKPEPTDATPSPVPDSPTPPSTKKQVEEVHTAKSFPVKDSVPLVTEEALLDKIKYEAKLKSSRMFRLTEYIRDHQSQTRAAILGIPSAAVAYTTYDVSTYIISVLDSMALPPSSMMHSIMALGALNAGVVYGLYYNANKILTLAGQPSESVIHDIIRRTCRNDTLLKHLGPSVRIGHFCSVGTRVSEPRFSNNKLQHYEEWLNFDKGQFSSPIPDIPFPHFVQKWLSFVPAFQTVAFNSAAAEKIAADIKAHPEDYLENYDANVKSSIEENLKTKKATQDEQSDGEESNEELSEQEKKQLAEREARDRKYRVTNNTGWERYWKPRRLQFSLHLIGEKDEGILLCEVEKHQFGKGFPHSGGTMQYKVFQFISLRDGSVVNIDSPERPSLISHAHITKLFDTIPVVHPNVPRASYDHILVEDKYADEIANHVKHENLKTGVHIYH